MSFTNLLTISNVPSLESQEALEEAFETMYAAEPAGLLAAQMLALIESQTQAAHEAARAEAAGCLVAALQGRVYRLQKEKEEQGFDADAYDGRLRQLQMDLAQEKHVNEQLMDELASLTDEYQPEPEPEPAAASASEESYW